MRAQGFTPHLIAQASGAINDNLLRNCLSLAVVGTSQAPALLGLAFLLPFLVLAPLSGTIATRWAKDRVGRWIRLLETPLLLAAAAVFLAGAPLWPAALVLAGLGAQSALFAATKYAIVPELVANPGDFDQANARLGAATDAAIVAGLALSALGDPRVLAHVGLPHLSPVVALLVVALSVNAIGIVAAFRVPRLVVAQAQLPWSSALAWHRLFSPLSSSRGLWAPALGQALAWMLLGVLYVLTVSLSETFALGQAGFALLSGGIAVCMGLGCLLAPRLHQEARWAHLPMMAALLCGAALVSCAFAVAAHHALWCWISLGLAATTAGAWTIPCHSALQQRSHVQQRGQVFAAVSLLANSGTMLGFVLITLLGDALGQDGVLLCCGLILVAGAGTFLLMRPGKTAAWLVATLVHLRWPTHVQHAERLPRKRGAVLIANHLSYADGVVLAAALPERAVFMVYHRYTSMPGIGWLLRAWGVIPVGDGPTAGARALRSAITMARAGRWVVIFPEGKITRNGKMARFQMGALHVAREAGVDLIPLALRGLEDGLSARGGRFRAALFRRVHIAVGPALPTKDPAEARQAVASLHAELVRNQQVEPKHNLAAACIRASRRAPWRLAVADAAGHLSRLALCTAAQALRKALALDRERHPLGVLLPPGRAGAITSLAIALSGRTAVHLNHTLGPVGLRACMSNAGITQIISAKAYLQKLGDSTQHLPCICLEDILPRLGTWQRLRAALVVLLLPTSWLCRAQPTDLAAIVYSSGTTGTPKGVELTHAAMLANITACLEHLDLQSGNDCVLSPLPLFHSLGLTVGCWLPLIGGLPVIGQPDPRDATGIAKLCQKYPVTCILGTPTFVRGWMRRVEPADLQHLRLAIVGAERCPEELHQQFRQRYGVALLEGYGCTELGPVVACNVPDVVRDGVQESGTRLGSVGKLLPGIALQVVDPETRQPLAAGQEGLILIHSPARMRGYHHDPERTAAALHGEAYITGDVGHMDADGFVFLTGRLARFAKLGGEMVPLDRIEEQLSAALRTVEPEAQLAVTSVSDSTKGERLLVLHNASAPNIPKLLASLDSFPALWRPRPTDWYQVSSIPELGTGKRDLGALRRLGEACARKTTMLESANEISARLV